MADQENFRLARPHGVVILIDKKGSKKMRIFIIGIAFGGGLLAAQFGPQLWHSLQGPSSAAIAASAQAGQARAQPQALPGPRTPCEAYNQQLDEAVALQIRINRGAEATRLAAMKQSCSISTPAVFRSAKI